MSFEKRKTADSGSPNEIHIKARTAAHRYRSAEVSLVEALIEVENNRVFLAHGFSSLFSYSVECLGLSESISYNCITAARKAAEIPELLGEMRNGNLSVSKIKKIASVITPVNQAQWIEKAKTLSMRKLEKEVARVNPRSVVPERVSYVSENLLSVSLGVTEELMLKLRRAQDLVSQSRGVSASLEMTLAEMVAVFLHQKDPVEKAKRIIAKKGSSDAAKLRDEGASALKRPSAQAITRNHPTKSLKTQFTGTVSDPGDGQRRPFRASVLHRVRLRDQKGCQYRHPDGSYCRQKRWLDIHHIRPVSEGGTDSLENLITLCRAHHQYVHRIRAKETG